MNIFLFGTGGHAKVVADAITAEGKHRILGVVSADGLPVEVLPGLEVIGSNESLVSLIEPHGADGAFVALGDNSARANLTQHVCRHLPLINVVHPSAVISPHATIGAGTVVMPGAIINAGTVIGDGCIINTRASVDHDCVIGDFVHICPGTTLAGHVSVGRSSWIGLGSSVVDHLSIGERVFVAAGSVVTKNLADYTRFIGRSGRRPDQHPV